MRFQTGVSAVIDQGVHPRSKVIAPRHHHPALATHGEVFRGKEGETGDIADAARFDARCCHSAVCLSGVFDVSDAVIMTPLNQCIIAHLSKEVNGDDGFGSWRSCRFK